MFFCFFLLLYLIGCEATISCTGTTTFCIQNDENCYLTCKSKTNVTLVREKDGCLSPNVLYTNTTGNLVKIEASSAEEATYSCCKNKIWECSSTVIVSHEVKGVSCIWDLKNDTVLSCSVAGILNDDISNKFQISMIIDRMGMMRPLFDEACDAISKFVFSCPLHEAFHDSKMYIYVTMEAKSDATVNSEKTFAFTPIAKHKELEIEIAEVTSETCTLNLKLPEDYLGYLCPKLCNITIEISYTDNNFIESHNRTTNESYVPSIDMTNLQPNTLHDISIKWKRIEDDIWSHILNLNFTTKIGVPKTSPLVLNKAKGLDYIGIYIQKRSEDNYYGPISLVLNKTTRGVDGQRARRDLPESQHLNFSQTVFVKYDETGNESITLQYATSAGISSENSEVIISPQQEIHNVKRLNVTRYNRTHDSLTIDSIDGVDSLHYYWCYGEYLYEKQLVDCHSIGHVESHDVKKTSYVKRPASDTNCTDCQLHYGVAIQHLNKSSSILWDSASEPLISSIVQTTGEEETYLYLYILIGVFLVILLIGVVCCIKRGYKQAKKMPQPTWPRGNTEVPTYESVNESFNALPETGLSSESGSNSLTATTSTSFNSDESDRPDIVVDTDTSNSDPYR